MDYKQKFCSKSDYKNRKYAHKISYTAFEDLKEHFEKKTELSETIDIDIESLQSEFKISDTVIIVGDKCILYATNLKTKSPDLVNVLTFSEDTYECVIV